MAVILSERGPQRFLQLGGGESQDLLSFGLHSATAQIETRIHRYLGSLFESLGNRQGAHQQMPRLPLAVEVRLVHDRSR